MKSPLDPKRRLSHFRGRRVLVTGDTGFKGSWLCLWLRELGAEVLGYALPPLSQHDLFCQLGLSGLIRHVNGDIRDANRLRKTVRDFKPEILFHLAAQSLVRLSYEQPALTFETNVIGSVNVLEAARACPTLGALVYVTSDKCYRNFGQRQAHREEDELGGADPYSASKACAELALGAYQESFFKSRSSFGAASARAGNVIGGGDWAKDRIVPDTIRALLLDRPLVLRNPKASRPWQHVLDALFGYLNLAATLSKSPERHAGAWNFGPPASKSRTVLGLVRQLSSCWGKPVRIRVQASDLPESRVLNLDSRKSQRLGWGARWDFATSTQKTASWYKTVRPGADPLEATRQQLREYLV